MSVYGTFEENVWLERLADLGLVWDAQKAVLHDAALAAVRTVHMMANVRRAALRAASGAGSGT
eukprot:1378754-Rhodomonas_salina.3